MSWEDETLAATKRLSWRTSTGTRRASAITKVLTDEEAAALAPIDAAFGARAEDVEHLGERFFR